MNEYIVKETGYPGTLKQEIVGELVRCKDCRNYDENRWCSVMFTYPDDYWPYGMFYCAIGERKDDGG